MLVRLLVKKEANLHTRTSASMSYRDGDGELVMMCGPREGQIQE